MNVSCLLALTCLLAAGGVQAQDSTLYGVMDAGVERVSQVASAGGSITRMPSFTGLVPSRVGVRGKENLGAGLSAIYTLELALFPDSGALAQGGRLFGRQSMVGLSTAWGDVTLGRQPTMLLWSLLESYFVGPGIYGIGSMDFYAANARVDNSVAFKGRFGGFTVGATYSLGRDTVNAGPSPAGMNCAGESGADAQACREWSAMLKYDAPTWGTSVGYDALNGRSLVNAADGVLPAGLVSSDKTDARLSVNGYVNLAGVKVGGGVIRRHNEGDAWRGRSDLWYLNAAYPLSPVWTLDGTLASLRYPSFENSDASLVAVRTLYKLSARTTVYAQVAGIRNASLSNLSVSAGAPGSNPVLGGSQTGSMLGVKHTF